MSTESFLASLEDNVHFIYYSILIVNFVAFIIIAYWQWQLWESRNKDFIKKRHPFISLVVIIAAFIYCMIVRPIADLPVIKPSINLSKSEDTELYIRLL